MDDLERERPFPGTPGFLDHDREVEAQVKEGSQWMCLAIAAKSPLPG
jgi:hypothetical protein